MHCKAIQYLLYIYLYKYVTFDSFIAGGILRTARRTPMICRQRMYRARKQWNGGLDSG